jgi:hypothetical protein
MATSAFGKAFREARAAGDKTFMFNGKKYTTDLAPDVASVGGKPEFGKYKSRDTYNRQGQEETSAKYVPRRTPGELTDTDMPGTRTRYENTDTSDMGMKKGGKVGSASKRADGIAERGKTRGTIVMCGGGYMKGKK